MRKYIGRIVEIIYIDRKGRFTQRKIKVHSVKDGKVSAYCYERKESRIFYVDNILAMQLVMRYAV